MDPQSLPGNLARRETWAKCDVVVTVSLERLDRVLIGNRLDGRRIYVAESVTADDLEAIRGCVAIALGLTG